MWFQADVADDPDNNKQLTLSPKHAVSMWIYPDAFGNSLLSKHACDGEEYWLLELSNTGYPIVTLRLFGTDLTNSHTCQNAVN